jgi:hypothetical protein
MKIINTLMGVRIMTPSTSLDLFDHGFPEKTTEPLSLLSPWTLQVHKATAEKEVL